MELPEGVIIRGMLVRDLDKIQELYFASRVRTEDPFQRVKDNQSLVAWSLRRVRQQLIADQSYFCVVAVKEESDDIIGYCAGLLERSDDVFEVGHYGSIQELELQAQVREGSLGEALVRALISRFEALGVRWVEATYQAKDVHAASAFKEAGFGSNTIGVRLELGAKE